MPGYDFTSDEARDVTIALLAQTNVPVLPDPFVVRSHASDSLAVSGEFRDLIDHYRCLSCHSVRGIGHNITYDLGVEGSRARKEWLAEYLKMPYTLRPILTVRMPIFHLSDHEVAVLADGIASSWRDAVMDSIGDVATGPREIEAGRRLFESKGCMSCHQVGAQGGYVGPGFTAGTPIGKKLRPGWIVKWLENPQAIKPDVLEPRYGFSPEEARQLTAYLMTLKSPPSGGSK
jgi:mono/diheme cytochrome c family protein